MSARFELHGIALSGPTYKVGLTLSFAGEAFDYVHVPLREGAHKQPAYLAKQRFGQVPLLIDRNNGRHLCQSAAILEYLADTLGRFGGATLEERLQIREWLYWDFDRLAPSVYRTRSAKRGFRQFAPEVLEMYAAEAAAALKVLDDHLAGRSWIVGEGVTIADIDVFGVLALAGEAEIDLSPYAHVGAWLKRMEALPGAKLPQNFLPMESKAAA
ncbi:glutathione S-transferase family protein [Microvirga sp. ACRRW]|uniref:glutathione S-transferase family protein n=1 Tax=Microvirga sp. ACRRW TaxID=2918205 RepID=UPI001EF6BFBC|nr:glutathione S-transferase family protein [Microvirga sp. ACRRW]